MNIKNIALMSVIAACSFSISAKTINLTPPVKSIKATSSDGFMLGRNASITDPTGSPELVRVLEEAGIRNDNNAKAKIIVELADSIPGSYDYQLYGYPDESYMIKISNDTILMLATNPTGVVRASQTLRQLAQGSDKLEGMTITDWPAFKLRGWMHDVGRSYFSLDELKRQIDMVSRFKVNTFHWHMTENQAFRFGSKKYPQLNSEASMTRYPGLYYTPEQAKELEEYAAERGVTIIPEIDMPGHSEAFERAMGFSMQTDEGVKVLQDILEEVCDAFPKAPYIHIGADEKQIVYPDFLKIMIDKVHSLGRKVAVWNPIHGVKVNKDMDIDLVTLWSTAGRKVAGVPNVDLRYNYTNHFDVFSDLMGIYKSSIYYADKGDPEIAGTIQGYWNDRKLPTEADIVKQNNMYANILASTERAWKGGGKEYIETGGVIFPNEGEEFDEFADWERRFLYHKENTLPTDEIPYVKQTNVKWHLAGPFPNNGDMNMSFAPEKSLDKITWPVTEATGAAPILRHCWNEIVPAYFTKAGNDQTAYAYTYIYSPKNQKVGALIEFQNYSRSEKDLAPDAGKWDRKGSRIWLNDKEILPPVWANSGKKIDNEVDLGNENLTARKPTVINLKKGWNKVLVKLPFVKVDGIRLNKWMFTFVITDPEGKKALENIQYSPTKEFKREL